MMLMLRRAAAAAAACSHARTHTARMTPMQARTLTIAASLPRSLPSCVGVGALRLARPAAAAAYACRTPAQHAASIHTISTQTWEAVQPMPPPPAPRASSPPSASSSRAHESASSASLDALLALLRSRGFRVLAVCVGVGTSCYAIWDASAPLRAQERGRRERAAEAEAWRNRFRAPGMALNPTPPSSSSHRGTPLQVVLVLGGIIVACGAVFLMSRYLRPELMIGHFACSWSNVMVHKRYYTLLTSAFTHFGGMHLLFNMVTLWGIAQPVLMTLGVGEFMAFFVASSIFSSLTQLAYDRFLSRPGCRAMALMRPHVGASGALLAVFGFIVAVWPENGYNIMFIPVRWSAESLALVLAAFDVGGMLIKTLLGQHRGFAIGHACHFGGLVFGYAYAQLVAKLHNPYVQQKLKLNEWRNKQG